MRVYTTLFYSAKDLSHIPLHFKEVESVCQKHVLAPSKFNLHDRKSLKSII